MQRSSWLAAVTVAITVLGSAPAWADNDIARQHFETGKARRDEGDCGRAISEFEKSLAAERSIGAYYNLAYCHEQLNDRQQAYEAYRQAQQLARARRDDRLPEISGALGSLMETPNVRVIFSRPLPPGLLIRVDDQLVAPALYHDETVIFTTKPQKSHSVVVSAPGHEDWRGTIDSKQFATVALVEAGHAEREQKSETSWGWSQWVGITTIAVGAGLSVFATIDLIDYESSEHTLRDRFNAACDGHPTESCPAAKQAGNDYTDNQSRRFRPAIAYAAGGVLIGGGVLLFLFGPSGSKTPATAEKTARSFRIVPAFDGCTQGLAAVGTF